MAKTPKTVGQRPEQADGPHAVISAEQIADLWERGYTVIPRTLFGRDPYAVADATKRPGMAQQWGDKPKEADYRAQGWRMVHCEAWPGLFAPYGAIGAVEIDGLALMQRPQHEVDRMHAQSHAQAHQNVEDWKARQEAAGFTVEVKQTSPRSSGDAAITHEVDGAPTVDTTVGIPSDMMPYVREILAERDRICEECAKGGGPDQIVEEYDAAIKANPQAPKWPTLRAIVMPKAIENVRAKLKAQEGAANGNEAKDTTHGNSDRPGSSTDHADGSGGDDPAHNATGPGSAVAPAADGGDGTAARTPVDEGDASGHQPPAGA